jgi:quinol monooxygenase YgiN
MSEPFTGPDAQVAEPITLINLFTVPLEESKAFLHHWRRSARIMAARPGFVRARLHQALDDSVRLRFVNVAQWASGVAFDRARTDRDFLAEARRVLDEPDLHITGQPAPYRVALEVRAGDPDDRDDDGRPRSHPVVQISPFTVPPEESERFLRRLWEVSRITSAQPGFVGGRLYRSLDDGVEFTFVDVGRWSSWMALDRAMADPRWQASVQHLAGDPRLRATGRPALYRVAFEVHPDDGP